MIKDLGNQKLPRFRAGEPLVEQITAERMNDICSMIEACRIQNGVGYTMNRGNGGTTLSILDTFVRKNSRPYRIDLGEEFSQMEESMLAMYIAKDDEELPELYKPSVETLRSAIISGFTTLKKFPKDGDAIWNESDGLRYIVFSEKTFKDGGGINESDFYVIRFELGKSDNIKTYYALYVGEHPKEPSSGRVPTEPIPGPSGPRGPEGPEGPQGPKGDKGDDGEKGEQGEQGERGEKGEKGDKGDKGETGDKIVEKIVDSGAYDDTEIRAKLQEMKNLLDEYNSLLARLQGLTNDEIYLRQQIENRLAELESQFEEVKIKLQELATKDGIHDSEISALWAAIRGIPKGEKGDQGEVGPQGPQGIQGVKGDKGEKGDTGPMGPQGPSGGSGGTVGPQGPKGDKGDKGEKGETGAQGPMGPQGAQGIQGATGAQGPKGDKGDTGDSADTSALAATVASLESRMSNAENRISNNENAIVNLRQNVDYVKQTIDSAVNVAVVDANGNVAVIKVLQHAEGQNLMTNIYYFDPTNNMMSQTKVFSTRSDQLVTGWQPTTIHFIAPSGEEMEITMLADQSTLKALGEAFRSEPCEVCDGGQSTIKYFLTNGTSNPEGN